MTTSAIQKAFDRARVSGRRALVPFLMSGYPTRGDFRAALARAATLADVIEVGVPFSDPLADGPVIQAAAARALQQGTTLAQTLEDVTGIEGPPVVLMLSINQVLAGGAQMFAQRLKAAGVAGAIVPDLPFEEAGSLRAEFSARGLELLNMLAPTTAPDRMATIAQSARGFLYLISSAGVTGTRDTFPPETLAYIRRARELSRAPVCVGFGISRPEHIRQLADADGFIVGSALIKAQGEGRDIKDVLQPLHAAL
ncbi:MAG: tryptophan synthase subunit alpha [Planctomycetes bacterium]|nr:tryptophan synthase subunit alpha [Planctomycetota bacterium]MCL4730274.1 tryptophan synthase subunit alpha [Planctomycetota bacterium]